jgi:hypothetical protein
MRISAAPRRPPAAPSAQAVVREIHIRTNSNRSKDRASEQYPEIAGADAGVF